MDLKEIQEIISEQSAKCSAIGRQIALGLMGVTWAFFFSDKQFSSHFLLFTALFSEILYYLVDFSQYFFVLISYKRLYTNTHKILTKRDDTIKDEDLEYSVLKVKSEINKKGFRFFFVKFPMLIISFITLLLYIVLQIVKTGSL